MDEYAGRIVAGRYRLPLPPPDGLEPVWTRAFDTFSGQEVLIRRLPLQEQAGAGGGFGAGSGSGLGGGLGADGTDGADGADGAAQRALEAARAAAEVPDHPRLVQVFDVLLEAGSVWAVCELVPARSLAELLAERPLSPYRAAELAADLLAGLRSLHAQGWTHRNITAQTVLVCADGRAMLDGLAIGAAQEALCGYDPVPQRALAAARADGRTAGPDPDGQAAGSDGDGQAAGSDGDRSGRPVQGRAGAPAAGLSGPETPPAMERARQLRLAVVGPVTERWAPEQACAVQENWQLAPPVGPAADLWALGALLYRCVQGYPPFPEENAAELAKLVCARPPAPAEECGPLRPVVESLLRQDPAERAGGERLRGWLVSLVRSAPEPDLGTRLVQVPADPRLLPARRAGGELVRRDAADGPPTAPALPAGHGRHARPGRRPAAVSAPPADSGRPAKGSRRLGATLLALILVLVIGALAYAVLFMPRSQAGTRTGSEPPSGPASAPASPPAGPGPTTQTATTAALPPGFTVRQDPAGFSVAVHDGWTRSTSGAEIRYTSPDGAFRLIVVPGRDSAAAYGSDPIAYETDREPELAAFRASNWSSSAGLQRVEIGGAGAAEGEFAWLDSGRHRYARNLAILTGGSYHIVLVVGPDAERDPVSAAFTAAAQTYKPGT